jgi:hypothetical protein
MPLHDNYVSRHGDTLVIEANTWCPLFTAAIILSGSFVHRKGRRSELVSARSG